MAGDWIKVRDQLRTHPKMVHLHQILTTDKRYRNEFFSYILYVPTDSEEGRNAIRYVRNAASRSVTLAVTLHVWCAVNEHAKMIGDDAVMYPMTLEGLGAIAGIDSFGFAMEEVGYVIADKDANVLTFPNFAQHNKPASIRGEPKDGARRQQEFRDREKARRELEKHIETTRNESNESNAEKRREEKTILKPLKPLCDSVQPKPDKPTKAVKRDLRFDEWWVQWPVGYKANRKKALATWKIRNLDDMADVIIADTIKRKTADDNWVRGFIPNPTTYLNGDKWTDDYRPEKADEPVLGAGDKMRRSIAETADRDNDPDYIPF